MRFLRRISGGESISGIRAGWTIGGGIEWSFAPNWSAKAEYLYYDLGSATYNLGTLNTTSTGLSFTRLGVSSTADFRGNIVRVGLNYRFNLFGPPAPVVAQ
ncbi:MAG: outer membrane beta-barrel protein [Candidatus Sulfotelmatobacter sp.]